MLNELRVKKAKPKGSAYKLTDARGMYLLVTPSGGKLWHFDYRHNSKRKTLALGAWPDVSIARAREKLADARRLVADGVDAAGYYKAQKEMQERAAKDTFEAIAAEWLAKHSATWASSHASKIEQRLKKDILPWLGRRPVKEITAPEILSVVRRIEARGAGDTAHRALQNIGQIMRFAIATGRAERNPAADLKGALAPVRGNHFAALLNPQDLGAFLRSIGAFKGTAIVATALRIAPYLFQRPGELRCMKWADVDVERREWKYIVPKTKTPHIVPLAPPVIAALEELRPLTGASEFVFPSMRDPKRPMSDAAMTAALKRMGFDTQREVSVHGLRATARSLLSELLHFPAEVIERQLAHRVAGPLGDTYARAQFLPERRRMMDKWADFLDGLTGDGNVIPLRKSRRKS